MGEALRSASHPKSRAVSRERHQCPLNIQQFGKLFWMMQLRCCIDSSFLLRHADRQSTLKRVSWVGGKEREAPTVLGATSISNADIHEESTAPPTEGLCSLFPRQVILTKTTSQSGLGQCLAIKTENDFLCFSQFSTARDAPGAVNIKIWFPFDPSRLPLDVSIVSTATVQEAIGYILFEYTENKQVSSQVLVRFPEA